MARSGLKELPLAWLEGLVQALQSTDPDVARQAVATAKGLPARLPDSKDLVPILKEVAGRANFPADLRLGGALGVPRFRSRSSRVSSS